MSACACRPGWQPQPSDSEPAIATSPPRLRSVKYCKTHGCLLLVAVHDCHETDFWELTGTAGLGRKSQHTSLCTLISVTSEIFLRSSYSLNTSELEFLWRYTWSRLQVHGRGSLITSAPSQDEERTNGAHLLVAKVTDQSSEIKQTN